MDDDRFARLTRALSAPASRRAALGGALAALLAPAPAAAARCSARKPCGPCRVCRKHRCRRARDGAACPGGNCAAGACVATCAAGLADCDGDALTGCETDLRSDPAHCNACDNACPGLDKLGTVVRCVDGVCTFACDDRRYDVDGDPANGCEAEDRDGAGGSFGTSANVGFLPCSGQTRTATGKTVADAMRVSPPDYYAVTLATGCSPGTALTLTLTTAGGVPQPCYRLALLSDQAEVLDSVAVGGDNSVGDSLTRQFGSGGTVHFRVDDACGTDYPGDVTYTVWLAT